MEVKVEVSLEPVDNSDVLNYSQQSKSPNLTLTFAWIGW